MGFEYINNFDRILSSVYSDYFSETILNLMEEMLQKERLGQLLKGVVVDIGCGSGRILHLIREKYNADVIGVDLNPSMVYKDVKYLQEDMRHTSMPSSTATLVFSVNIADFLDDYFKAEDIFNEVDRVLISGGVYMPTQTDLSCLKQPYESAGYRKFLGGYQKTNGYHCHPK